MLNPKFVINFPTKRDWRAKSRYEDIEAGLSALVSDVRRLGITSIAVPLSAAASAVWTGAGSDR